jgi:MFS family permease
MSMTPWRRPGLGPVTTFVATWTSVAVLVLLGPRLKASAAVLVGIAAAFDVAAAAAVGAGAAWSRRVGSHSALVSGAAVFTVASAACALAHAVPLLVAARAVQGVAAALMVAAAFEALAADPDPAGIGDDGFLAGGVGAALVCGPLLAGAVAAVDGWRWVFWVDAAVGAGIGLVVLVRGARAGSDAPHHRDGAADPGHRPVRPRDRVDLLGLALVAVAVAGPVGALDEAATVGWWDIRTLGLFAAGVLALVPVLLWQTPLGALYGRAFVAAQIADLCLFAATAGSLFGLVQYFHAVLGAGPLQVGLRIVPWSVAVAAALPVSAVADGGARGMRRLISLGLALDAVGLLALAAAVRGRQTGWWLALSLILSGAGVGLALPAARRAAVTVAALRSPDGIVGGLGAVRLAGAGLGIALLGAVLAACGGLGPAGLAGHGSAPAVATAALLAAAGAAAALTLPARDRPPAAPALVRPDPGSPRRPAWRR